MTKSISPTMSFLLDALKKNKKATFAELKEAAEQKKLQVYPIMFGRAKAMLGLSKEAARGTNKAAKASSKPAASKTVKATGGSKSEQIRSLLAAGMKPMAIAKKVGCTPGLVYNVRSGSKGIAKANPRSVASRKTIQTTGVSGLEGIIEAVQENARETQRLRAALTKIQAVLNTV